MSAAARILYVFDAYCGWCYGFGPAIQAFHERHREDVPFDVVSGGLFVGDERVPLGSLTYVPEANRRVEALTGVTFGDGFYETFRDGTLVLDSTRAAAGFAALRDQAPERAVPLTAAVQRAFFMDGRSLNDAATFRAVAQAEGLDPEKVPDELDAAAAERDFAVARSVGATGYPTVLLVKGDRGVVLARGAESLEALESRLPVALERLG